MKNVGSFDASVRLVLSIAALYFGYIATEAMTRWALYIIAFILIWTAVTGHCFVYKLLGMNTSKGEKPLKKKEKREEKGGNVEKFFDKNARPTIKAVKAGKFSKAELKKLLQHEKKNKNRKTVVGAIKEEL